MGLVVGCGSFEICAFVFVGNNNNKKKKKEKKNINNNIDLMNFQGNEIWLEVI